MRLAYHIAASIFWRLVLLLTWPLALAGCYGPLVWASWWVLYHDDQTVVREE